MRWSGTYWRHSKRILHCHRMANNHSNLKKSFKA